MTEKKDEKAPTAEDQEKAPEGDEVKAVAMKLPFDRHSILEVRKYVDDQGRQVNEFIQVFGKSKKPNFYKGRAVMQVRVSGPGGVPMPPRNQAFEFDIEAMALKKAFELFDDAAAAALEDMRKQAQDQNRIMAARGEGMPLVGANGQPLPMKG